MTGRKKIVPAVRRLCPAACLACGLTGLLYALQGAFSIWMEVDRLVLLLVPLSLLGWFLFPVKKWRWPGLYVPLVLWILFWQKELWQQLKICGNMVQLQLTACFGIRFTPFEVQTKSVDVTLLAGTILYGVLLLLLLLTREGKGKAGALFVVLLPVLAGILLECPPDTKTVLLLLIYVISVFSGGSAVAGIMAGVCFIGLQILLAGQMERLLEEANAWGKSVLGAVTGLEEPEKAKEKARKKLGFQEGIDIDAFAEDGQVGRGKRKNESSQLVLQVRTKEKPEAAFYIRRYAGDTYTGESWKDTAKESVKSFEAAGMDRQINGPVFLRDLKNSGAEEEIFYGRAPVLSKEKLAPYLTVPKDKCSRLYTFCMDHPNADSQSVDGFIRQTLLQEAAYTLTPKPIPQKEDIADYFLFEGKEGYCVHFATVAVLMYRSYGIAARYATGYLVEPQKFLRQADGTYTADVRAGDAHAWPEVYDAVTGWSIMEVTPGSVPGQEEGIPGDDAVMAPAQAEASAREHTEPKREEMQQGDMGNTPKEPQQISEEASDKETGAKTEEAQQTKEGQQRKEADAKGSTVFWEKVVTEMVWSAGILLAAACFFAGRRRYVLQKRREEGAQGSFAALLRFLHALGYVPECDGQEADFGERLSACCEGIQTKDACRAAELMLCAAYSDCPLTKEEELYVVRFCEMTSRLFADRLPWWKKMWFRYGKSDI